MVPIINQPSSSMMLPLLYVLMLLYPLAVQAAPEKMTADTLAPGMSVPDFSLPASNGWGQRLAERKGEAVMLIWLDDCDRCEELLAPYQLLAEGLLQDGLHTWFIWTPDGDDQPPQMRLPVLVADQKWRSGWQFATRPAIMLIDADGVLDQLILGDLEDNFSRLEKQLPQWLKTTKRLR